MLEPTNLPVSGAAAVLEPRLAASVIMVRGPHETGGDGDPGGLEVFVQHRVLTMDFAAGMVVFPGGRVDPADHAAALQADYPEHILDRHARAWRQASIAAGPAGELRLMSAVLLAAAQREVGEETGARLAAEDLVPWANWVTPPRPGKRFDTFFYVARPRAGAGPRHQTTEAVASLWTPVREILAADKRGTLQLMRPTRHLLRELQSCASVEQIFGSERLIDPVR